MKRKPGQIKLRAVIARPGYELYRNLGQCQIDGCYEPAQYDLYRTSHGQKVWLHVCAYHEKIIGDKNMRRVGSRYQKGGDSGARKS